jgi:nucleotide-binding universal stress UspA family protein
MERILVAVDGSAPSLKAVEFAADLASKYNAELILLTVAPHPLPDLDQSYRCRRRDWGRPGRGLNRRPDPR